MCHLWNLVEDETREGDVYRKLLEKLEQARQSLGGQVFDVLGKLHFEGRPLRELMVEAIRYGEQPEVRTRLATAVDHALDRGWLHDLLEERALAHDAMDASRVQRIREDMVRARLRKRLEELELEAKISPLPPVVLGGLLVVPRGLIDAMGGRESAGPSTAADTQESAARARKIVMETERSLGFDPTDREFEKLGYDIESRVQDTGKLRFIEVKGRASGTPTITVTRNEILYSLNKPEDFFLGIVEFLDDGGHRVHYVREPFQREPDFGVTSVNYDFGELLARAERPS